MTAPDSVTTVLFDWNGTVLDDMERARRASSLVRQRWAGLGELTLDEFRETWCLPLSDHVMRLGVPAERSEAAGRAWSTHLSEVDAPLSPGVVATLESLRSVGIAIAVVSAAGDDAVRRDLRTHSLEQCFDSVHCGVADKQAVIRRYVESAGAGAVWYIGDTKMDMLQAREAGAVAMGYTRGFDTADKLHDGGAHRLIDRLSDVMSLIADTSPDRP